MTNPLALHAMVVLRGTDATAWRGAVDATAAAGFDVLEVPLREPAAVDVTELRLQLAAHDLQPVCVLALPFGADVSSADGAVVRRGERLLTDALDAAAALGSRYLGGVVYGAAGRHDRPVSDVGYRNCVGVLKRLASQAAEHDIIVGLEVVNRYESNLVNTADEGLALVADIGVDNVGFISTPST